MGWFIIVVAGILATSEPGAPFRARLPRSLDENQSRNRFSTVADHSLKTNNKIRRPYNIHSRFALLEIVGDGEVGIQLFDKTKIHDSFQELPALGMSTDQGTTATSDPKIVQRIQLLSRWHLLSHLRKPIE